MNRVGNFGILVSAMLFWYTTGQATQGRNPFCYGQPTTCVISHITFHDRNITVTFSRDGKGISYVTNVDKKSPSTYKS
jgi:hypothetical protein